MARERQRAAAGRRPRFARLRLTGRLLARSFLERFRKSMEKAVEGIAPESLRRLESYDWPGNVRELENVIGHACMMCMGDTLDVPDLPPYLQSPGEERLSAAAVGESGMTSLEDQEKFLVMRAMEESGGNQSQAARILRIGRDALRYKLKKHGL